MFYCRELNEYFGEISHDKEYVKSPKKSTVLEMNEEILSESCVFDMLDNLRETSPGLDALPSWFLRLAAPSISYPLQFLYNACLRQSFVPRQWKAAIITPVPKVAKPTSCADYRPISVTPILSRLFEKFIVRTYLYPVLVNEKFRSRYQDQYAFRPTGSTTAALIDIVKVISDMLVDNQYVHVLTFDVSKAFDALRHSTLLSKLANMPIPDFVYNWLVEYFEDRCHVTKIGNSVSTRKTINASIVQGSVIGPVSYILNLEDQRPCNDGNEFVKYADDGDLIVPAVNTHTIPSEIENINKWSKSNNLKLNISKSKEMIVYKHSTSNATI